jgi:uncharacterized membrane protein YhhN
MPTFSIAPIAATTCLVIALLVAERKASLRGVWMTKPLASLGFVWVACVSGATGSPYGETVLLALLLCALGDVLLITKGAGPAFLAGMAAFALGHAGFAAAFWQRGVESVATSITLVLMAGVAVVTLRWLGPRLPADMRVPIGLYIAIISVMVALAVGTRVANASPWLAVGAIAFAASDLSVARDRFVQPAFVNVLWGLPLYYAAQLVLAVSVY